MKKSILSLFAVVIAVSLACQAPQPPVEVVDEFEIARFLGRWYEIASYPQSFQEGCVATTADYSLRDDGRIRVVNACRNDDLDGELRRVEGVAWIQNPADAHAKLRVQFFWPFSGAYWIVDLDPNYRYAVIGHPSRDYLWVLSRTPAMETDVYEAVLVRVASQGFDLTMLNRTLQPGDPEKTE
jgi:apolipoprotein D and lipocalin family protein